MSNLVPPQPRLSELLADDLGLTPADIIAHIDHFYGRPHGLTDAEIIDIVRGDLDQHGCRTVPERFWPSEPRDTTVCRCVALGGREHAPGPECPMPPNRPNLPGI